MGEGQVGEGVRVVSEEFAPYGVNGDWVETCQNQAYIDGPAGKVHSSESY